MNTERGAGRLLRSRGLCALPREDSRCAMCRG